MNDQTSTLAVFDFDDTLIEGDSLWPFLTIVAGWPKAIEALVGGLFRYALAFFRHDEAASDFRTFLKSELLKSLLAGVSIHHLNPAIYKLCAWLKWNESVKKTLLNHHLQGHRILIISGALDLYLPELVKNLPHDFLICTKIAIRDGKATGIMSEGNCTRVRKAKLLKEYIAENGPFSDSWGYGNLPHDLPMLELVKQKIII